MILNDVHNGLTYFKRFRMEIDLTAAPLAVPDLPDGFTWMDWHRDRLELHARVKQQSFNAEIDGTVFPNLAHYEGCLRLMRDITGRLGFCAEATWLIAHEGVPCGTIQGVSDRLGTGVIQNLGVVPQERGHGIGTALLLKSVHAFRQLGLAKAALEVTARNEAALRLYRRLGFRRRRTLYKAVDVFASLPPAAEPDLEWWM